VTRSRWAQFPGKTQRVERRRGDDIPGSFFAGRRRGLLPKLVDRTPSLEFHQEKQPHAADGDDDQPGGVLTECERYAAGNDKDDDERMG
jgi:hypothetical protein